MLLGEILSNIRTNILKEVNIGSSMIRNRNLYYTFIRKRSTVIENRLRDDKKIAKTNSQVVACAKLVKTSAIECGCLDLIGCELWRTDCKLPSTLTNNLAFDIDSVTSIDGSIAFNETQWESFNYIKYNKYTADEPYFMVYNNYIIVINNYIDGEPIEYISFKGVFEDPIKALECNACIGDGSTNPIPGIILPECDSIYDFEFPLTGKLLDTAIQLTLQELIPNYKEISDAYQRSTDLDSDER